MVKRRRAYREGTDYILTPPDRNFGDFRGAPKDGHHFSPSDPRCGENTFVCVGDDLGCASDN